MARTEFDIAAAKLRRQATCLKAMRTLDQQLQRIALLLGDFIHNNDCMKGLPDVSVSKRDLLKKHLTTVADRALMLDSHIRHIPRDSLSASRRYEDRGRTFVSEPEQ